MLKLPHVHSRRAGSCPVQHLDVFIDIISVAWCERAGPLAAGGVVSVWGSWVLSHRVHDNLSVPLWVLYAFPCTKASKWNQHIYIYMYIHIIVPQKQEGRHGRKERPVDHSWPCFWSLRYHCGVGWIWPGNFSNPSLGWLYVFSSFPPPPPPPPPLLLLTSKSFELDLRYLGQRKYRYLGKCTRWPLGALDQRSRLWHR